MSPTSCDCDSKLLFSAYDASLGHIFSSVGDSDPASSCSGVCCGLGVEYECKALTCGIVYSMRNLRVNNNCKVVNDMLWNTCEALLPGCQIYATGRGVNGRFVRHLYGCRLRYVCKTYGISLLCDDHWFQRSSFVAVSGDIVRALGFDPNLVFLFACVDDGKDFSKISSCVRAPGVRWKALGEARKSFLFSFDNVWWSCDCESCIFANVTVFEEVGASYLRTVMAGCWTSFTKGCCYLPRLYFPQRNGNKLHCVLRCGVPELDSRNSFSFDHGMISGCMHAVKSKLHDVVAACSNVIPFEVFVSCGCDAASFFKTVPINSCEAVHVIGLVNMWDALKKEIYLMFFKGCKTLVDLGCGSGKDIPRLKKLGINVYVGVDERARSLEYASCVLKESQMLGWLIQGNIGNSNVVPEIIERMDRITHDVVPTVDGVLSWLGCQRAMSSDLEGYLNSISVVLKTGGYAVCCIPDHGRFVSYASAGVFEFDGGWFGFVIDKSSFAASGNGTRGFKYVFRVGNNVYNEFSVSTVGIVNVCAFMNLSIFVNANLLSHGWTNSVLKSTLSTEPVSGKNVLYNNQLRAVMSFYRLLVFRQEAITGPTPALGHSDCGCERCSFDKISPPPKKDDIDVSVDVGRAVLLAALQRYAEMRDIKLSGRKKIMGEIAIGYLALPRPQYLKALYDRLGWMRNVCSYYDPATREIFEETREDKIRRYAEEDGIGCDFMAGLSADQLGILMNAGSAGRRVHYSYDEKEIYSD